MSPAHVTSTLLRGRVCTTSGPWWSRDGGGCMAANLGCKRVNKNTKWEKVTLELKNAHI